MAPKEVDEPANSPMSVLDSLTLGAVDVLPEGRLAEQLAAGRPLRCKLGVDPTSPDIHLGHCVVLTKLRAFQDAGHAVVLIIGDYTARVGDPSGQDATRPVLTPEQIEANAQTYMDQAFKVLDRDRTEIRHNGEWLDMPSADFFDVVRRFTVARLLERDDFTNRMVEGRPISALELLYPVLQGYDSVAIDADVEFGGTDQKFNLLFGRDVQAAYGKPQQSVVTMPLLVGTDGKRKMSKSYDNYIAVNDPPEEMFGKLMSVPDDAMGDYYLLLLDEELDPSRAPNEAKRELARRLTDRFHGQGAGAEAEARFDQIHVRGELPDEIPLARVEATGDGTVHLPALIAREFELSTSEARRLIGQGGVRLDGEPLGAETLDVPAARLDGRVLQVGKRRFRRLAL
jgi:tyrosyl-tRNA synthetase